MAWGAAKRGVDDLVERLVNGDGGKTMLVMSNRKFGDNEAAKLCEALGDNTSVEELLCSGHTLTPTGARHFASALRKNTALSRLAIGCANFGDDCLTALLEEWENESLAHLDLELKSLTRGSMESLGKVLGEKSHALESLALGRNSIGDQGIAALASGLKSATSLRVMKLESNDIGVEGCVALGRALAGAGPRETKLELVLNGNAFGSEGLEALVREAETKHTGCHVGSLSLVDCEIGDEGAKALGLAIAVANGCFAHLHELKLGNNKITDASFLVSGISKENSKLVRIGLERNPELGPSGLAPLAIALSENSTNCVVSMLDVSSCGLEGDGAAPVLESLVKGSSLVELRLLGNKLGNKLATFVCEALKNNSTLLVMSLGGAEIDAEGCKSVLEALASNKALRTLELGGNDIGVEGREAVAAFHKDVRPELDIAMDKESASS
mmetsp:Transcript_13182/g.24440  ORF Transcript_13182/g.24440 Transcript_13182/m.24440 type:complete len:442 (-) Transcript_13182:2-1327(-)